MRYPNAEQVERVLEYVDGPRSVRGLAEDTGLTVEKVHAALRILTYRGAVVQVWSPKGPARWAKYRRLRQ